MFRSPRHPAGTHVVGSGPTRPTQRCRTRHGPAQPDPRRRRARGPRCSRSPTYTVELDLTDGCRRARRDRPSPPTTTVRFACREPGADELDRLRRRRGRLGHAERHARSTSSAYREDDGIALPGLAAENELVVVAHRPLHEHRRGPAPVRRPGRRRRLPLLPVRDRRRQADVRLLRPARPQGPLHRSRSPRPPTGRSSPTRPREVEQAGPAAVHRFATTEILSTYLVALVAGPYAAWRDEYSTTDGRRSRSASTAAPRSPSTWTPSGCSPRPSRASTSTTAASACGTRSASTTSCSCRSSTRARWRTPAR